QTGGSARAVVAGSRCRTPAAFGLARTGVVGAGCEPATACAHRAGTAAQEQRAGGARLFDAGNARAGVEPVGGGGCDVVAGIVERSLARATTYAGSVARLRFGGRSHRSAVGRAGRNRGGVAARMVAAFGEGLCATGRRRSTSALAH